MTPNGDDEDGVEGNEDMKKDEKKKCEGDDCDNTDAKEGADTQDAVNDIASKLKKK
jgi:hypothetical protein